MPKRTETIATETGICSDCKKWFRHLGCQKWTCKGYCKENPVQFTITRGNHVCHNDKFEKR